MSFNKTRNWIGLAAVVMLMAAFVPTANAQTAYSWQLGLQSDANWDDPGAWSPSGPPMLAGDSADFSAWPLDSNYLINVSLNGLAVKVGQLSFTGWNSGYRFLPGAGGTLTMDSGTTLPFGDPNGWAQILQSWPGGSTATSIDVSVYLNSSLLARAYQGYNFTQPITVPDSNIASMVQVTFRGVNYACYEGFRLRATNSWGGGTSIDQGGQVHLYVPDALPGPVTMQYGAIWSHANDDANADHSSTDIIVKIDPAAGTNIGAYFYGARSDSDNSNSNPVTHKFGGLTFADTDAAAYFGNGYDTFEFTGTSVLNGQNAIQISGAKPAVAFSGRVTGSGSLIVPAGNYNASSLTLAGPSDFTGGVRMEAGTLYLKESNAAGTGPITIAGSYLGAMIWSVADTNEKAAHTNDVSLVQMTGGSAAFTDYLIVIGSQTNWQDVNGNPVTHTFGGLTLGQDGNNFRLYAGYWGWPNNDHSFTTASDDTIRFTGAVSFPGAMTTLYCYQNLTLDGALTGTGLIVKNQTGTLTLNGANGTTGGLVISSNGGKVVINAARATGDGNITIGSIDNDDGQILEVNAPMAFGNAVIDQLGVRAVTRFNATSALGTATMNVYNGLVMLNEANIAMYGTIQMIDGGLPWVIGGNPRIWANAPGALRGATGIFNYGVVEANVTDALVGATLLRFDAGSIIRLRRNGTQNGAVITLNGGRMESYNTNNVDTGMTLNVEANSWLALDFASDNGWNTTVANLKLSNATLAVSSANNLFSVLGTTTLEGNGGLFLARPNQQMTITGNLTGSGRLYLNGNVNSSYILDNTSNHTGGTAIGTVVYLNNGGALGTGPLEMAGGFLHAVASNNSQADNSQTPVLLTANSTIVGSNGWFGLYDAVDDPNKVVHKFGGLTFATGGLQINLGTYQTSNDLVEFTGTSVLNGDSAVLSYCNGVIFSGPITGSGKLVVVASGGSPGVFLTSNGSNYAGGTKVGYATFAEAANALGMGPVELNGAALYSLAASNSEADHSRNDVVLRQAGNQIVVGQGGSDYRDYILDDPNAVTHKFGGLVFTADGQYFQAGDWYTGHINDVNLCGNDSIEFTGTSVLVGDSLVYCFRTATAFSGPITGSGRLVFKNGSYGNPALNAVLTLANTSSDYTGGTIIDRGGLALDVTGSNAMGTGPITIMDGSALNLKGASAANSTGSDVTVDGLLRVWTGGSGVVGAVAPGAVTYPDANFNYIRAVQLDAGSSLSVAKVRDLTVTVGDGAALTLRGGTSQVPSLTLAGATDAWTGLVDIRTSYVILPSATEAEVLNQVKQGANWSGTHWAGTGGITTSAGGGNDLYSVGVADNAIAKKSEFGDANGLPNSGVLVRYTYVGDTNLDGITDLDKDYYNWSFGYLNAGNNTWYYGDFNYDGQVDLDKDYYIWSYGYLNQGSPLVGGAESAVDTSPSSAPVPEPATVGLLAMGLAGLVRFRKHSR